MIPIKIMNKLLVLFYRLSLWNVIFYAQHISLGTSHISNVNSYMWPATALLDSTDTGQNQITLLWEPSSVSIVFKLSIPKQDPDTTSWFPSFVQTVSMGITRVIITSILRKFISRQLVQFFRFHRDVLIRKNECPSSLVSSIQKQS